MKKSTIQFLIMLTFLLAFHSITLLSLAQAPSKMSYQAVIRNNSNQLVTNQIVGMRISILKGSESGVAVYTETQKPTTNINGLVTVEIGSGITSNDFSTIDWANGKYFIKTETDPTGGTSYTINGVSQLLSVPYALYAKSSENGLTLPFSKSINSASQAFTITNTNGNAIRGISNGSGTGVFGENTSNLGSTTGVYGKTVSATGFGVHGSSPFVGVRGWSDTIAGLSYGVLGFAESPEGYAVYGRNMATSGSSIGVFGKSDSPVGYGVYGSSPEIGVKGNSTGTSGIGVSGIGASIGISGTATATTGPGAYAISGETQSPIGYGVYGGSYSNTGTTYGIYGKVNSPDGFSGYFEGGKFFTNCNVGIGTTTPGAGLHIKGKGFPSTFMFLEAAASNDAGFRINEGAITKWHIYNDFGAGGLQIRNSAFTTAIFAKQSNGYVGINTASPNYNLEVNGTAGKTGGGSWSTSSDIRLKNLLGNYKKGLIEIVALQPILFKYKEGNARNLPSDAEQIGFVAQEVQKVFPEAVSQGEDGYLDFNIHAIDVAMVNAVKELKAENDELIAESEKLKAENELLKSEIKQIDSRLTNIEKIIGVSAMK